MRAIRMGILGACLLSSLSLPVAALAHPSSSDTLTVDVLFNDRDDTVDVAAQRLTYEQRPTPTERLQVARDLLGRGASQKSVPTSTRS